MKKYTHAWLAMMAMKRLDMGNIPETEGRGKNLVAVILLMNLIPVVSAWLCLFVDSMVPYLFVLHSLLLFALLFDLLILSVAWLVRRVFSERRRRR